MQKEIQVLTEKYSGSTSIRALVQLIPYVGGALDLVLSEKGQHFRKERLEHYIANVADRMQGLEGQLAKLIGDFPEKIFDLLRSHLEEVDRSGDAERRKQFANILLNQASRLADWSESETATRLLKSLTTLHIHVLREICNAPICLEPFEGLRVSTIEPVARDEGSPQSFLVLAEIFPTVPIPQLRLIVIELVSTGLIRDEGVGRFGAAAMEKFSPLPSGEWLLNWISR